MTQPSDWKQQARAVANANCLSFHDNLELMQGVPELISPVPIPEGAAQGPLLLRTLFGDKARVCVATGKSNAATKVVTAGTFTIKQREQPEGAWFKVNELIREKPSGRNGGWADADTATRYLLLEMDHAGQEEQWKFWSAAIGIGFPVVSLTASGNKSLHALIRLDAPDIKSHRAAADRVMALLSPFIPDTSTRNPSRYSRLPGVIRGSKGEQRLEYLNPEAPVWSDSCGAASLLRDFAPGALPLPEKLRTALQRGQEARERPADGTGDREFMKKLGKLTGFREVDLLHYAVGTGWHQFSSEPVTGLESRHYVHCPWDAEHTGGGDTDSATDAYLYERVTEAKWRWGFHCSHHACQGRDIMDVLELAKTENPDLFAECLAPEPDVLSGFDGLEEPPEGAAPAAEWTVPESLVTSAPNDVDNCHIFMALHRGIVRHVRQPSKWLVWDSTRWKPDGTGRVEHLAKDVEKLRRKHAGDDPDARKMAKGAGSAKAIANILTLASSEPAVAVPADSFDTDPWLVGCVNGTLDLRTGILRAARPGDMISMQICCRYDPTAVCRRYDQFLEEIHPDDPNITAFLDRFSGYCLSGSAREDRMLIFHGPKGRNGKSTLVKVLSSVLGDYAAVMPAGFLAARKGGTDPNAPDAPMAALKGKRLALISETNENVMLDEAKVKMLTGGEMISVRRVFGTEQEQMALSAKVIVSSNHRPEIKGTDPAIWSRILLVPFNETFADNPDRNLFGKLMEEREGILARMVRGCLAYREHGLDIPKSILASTTAYREDEDVLAQFLSDRTTAVPTSSVAKSEIYTAYHAWVEQKSVSPIWNQNVFTRKMSEKGFSDRKSDGERLWVGLKLD